MAIIQCEKCGKKYSDNAPGGCPNCINAAGIDITCPLCKAGKMHQTAAQLFTDPFVRFCGVVFVLPALIGVFSAFSYLFNAETVSLSMRVNIFAGMFALSMVSGVFGWLLLSKRTVWKCENCGHYKPRQ